ncbi:MAG: hypothetical protein COB67_02475 [SAR324 cluster bacterium]|uniref:Uncharacterized protein n=1 Tax=SAR324 cluster bacterium TaxID=2024889 RepID=A0A2A4T961_9DELT|nr:MAG: hypothetical protein COB67_02475 [SAR324 cluster bacterium]
MLAYEAKKVHPNMDVLFLDFNGLELLLGGHNQSLVDIVKDYKFEKETGSTNFELFMSQKGFAGLKKGLKDVVFKSLGEEHGFPLL